MTSARKKRMLYRVDEGLTPEIVEQISKEKHDPASGCSFSACSPCRSIMT